MSLSFADELAAFRARTADPGFAALILLGTRQATTAALLIGTLAVERVAFLLTDATRTMPYDVAALLGRSADAWLCIPGDHSTTLAVYQGLRQLMEQWAGIDRAGIAVDVTGGLKPMSVGVEKAAHLLGLTTIYIESDYGPGPDGRVGPIAGTQRLILPPNPYLVFGDLEAEEATRQYRQHSYAVAAAIFGRLAVRVPENASYAAAATLASAYAQWEVFGFAEAGALLGALLAQPLAHLPGFAPHVAALAEQQAALDRLSAISGAVVRRDDAALRTLADPAALLALLGTLHAAAQRRAAQERYDFAALFRYRCLELISQHRLASYGILTNAPRFAALGARRAEVSERFQQQQRAAGRSAVRGLGKLYTIGLFDSYMLLAALDDPLVRGYDLAQIKARTDARNHSVLAHGYRLIGRAQYAAFAEVVDAMIDRLFAQVLGRPRADWERLSEFVDPF